MNSTKYWIATISKEHIMLGVAGNFIQVCHGKKNPLKKIKNGDFLIIYSPKTTMNGIVKLQAFTAIGQIKDDKIYQVSMSENFHPFRRDVIFMKCKEIPIIPLIDKLDFIQNKKFWGYPFKFGLFEINKHDFDIISNQMLQDKYDQK